MSDRSRLLLLAPKTSYRIEPFIRAAEALGVDVRIGSNPCKTLSAEWGVPLALDYRHPERAVEQVVAYARDEPFGAVVATDDASTVIAAGVGQRLGLPANPIAAAHAARNKLLMREHLRAAGVRCPDFRAIDAAASAADSAAAMSEVGGPPVVVKPLLMSGSRGVIRADDELSLHQAVARVGRILRAPDVEPSDDPAAGRLIIERFVAGTEIAVEGLLTADGLRVMAVFDKPDPLDGPFFEETIYLTPSGLDASIQQLAAKTVEAAARAIGLVRGPVHAELRVGGDVVTVIEVAGRSIGGLCSRTIELTLGRQLEEWIIRDALDLPLPSPGPGAAAAGVMMLPIPRRGLLRSVGGIDQASAIEGVESIEITAKTDHELVPLPEGASYLGFLFARGETPAAVEAALRAAQAELRFEIVPSLAFRSRAISDC